LNRLVTQTHAALEILCRGHAAALKVLVGEAPPPTVEQIAEIIGCFRKHKWLEILGTRVSISSMEMPAEQTYVMAEAYNVVIDQAGGWEHIQKVTKQYIKHNATYWYIFRDYLIWMDKIPCSRKGYVWQGDVLSKKYNYSLDHLRRIRKQVLRDLAKAVIGFDKTSE